MHIESADAASNPSFESAWWTPRLTGPLIAAAVVRLTLLAVVLTRSGTSGIIIADTASYLIPGRNLLLHGHFVADGMPDLLRTPGYPLFLAVTSLAGLPAAAVANVLLSVFNVFLVWRLGRAVSGNDRIALVAAWIFAFEPLSVVFSVVLLSETLFLALFLLSMERLAEFLHRRRLWVLAVAGLWLAAATYVRPVTYYLPVALAVGLFFALMRVPGFPPQRQRPVAGGPGLRWKAPAVILISVLPWLAAWQVRNRMETGYSGFCSISEKSLYFVTAAEVTARVEHRKFNDVDDEFGYYQGYDGAQQAYLYWTYLARHREQIGWSQGQRLAFMHSEAAGIIRAHFGVYLYSFFQALVKTAFNPSAGYFDRLLYPEGYRPAPFAAEDKDPIDWGIVLARTYPWIAAEKVAFLAVLLGLYLFAARGVYLAVRGIFDGNMHSACLWLLLGTSLYFLAVSAVLGGVCADARYRLPVMPVVCIFAAAGARRAKTLVSAGGLAV
jgi:hypothetical protein